MVRISLENTQPFQELIQRLPLWGIQELLKDASLRKSKVYFQNFLQSTHSSTQEKEPRTPCFAKTVEKGTPRCFFQLNVLLQVHAFKLMAVSVSMFTARKN